MAAAAAPLPSEDPELQRIFKGHRNAVTSVAFCGSSLKQASMAACIIRCARPRPSGRVPPTAAPFRLPILPPARPLACAGGERLARRQCGGVELCSQAASFSLHWTYGRGAQRGI
jgi:hypothetical protein